MGGLPDVLFVIDTNKESIAVAEANKLGIPVVGVIDSNSSPDGIDYPIPGNDDSIRAINFYCDLISGSVLSGIQAEMATSGTDIGALEEAPVEVLPDAEAVIAEVPAEETPAEAAPAEAAPAEATPAETVEAAAPEAPVEEAAPAKEEQPAAS